MAQLVPARRRIHRLPPQLANQIAAGEVVERPASVLKELVENSLDAGATRIDIEIEAGGVGLIRVVDNGFGIDRDELALAVSRHATSKIAAVEELNALQTLGFRGEALASIGSVSRLSITSRSVEADMAWCFRSGPNAAQASPQPSSRPPGTTVEVQDLFYNVPARRKFLRSERTEVAHLEDVVKRATLSHPTVTFTLRHQGRVVLHSQAATEQTGHARRVGAVFGDAFVATAHWVDASASDMRLRGWLSPPAMTRSQTDLQYVYVNDRAVRDRLLAHALRQAYDESLPPGRHPLYVLHFQVVPELVDVNVHPTKHEVRFRNARSVHDFVYASARRALADRVAAAEVAPAGADRRISSGAGAETIQTHRISVAEATRVYSGSVPRPIPGTDEPSPLGRALGVVAGRFLLASRAEHLVVVDLERAQRALWREGLVAALAEATVVSRPLLIPVAVAVGAQAARRAESAGERLRKVGLDISRAGESEILVRAVPQALAAAAPEALARAGLDCLSAGAAEPVTDMALVDALVSAAPLVPLGDQGEMDRFLGTLAGVFGAEPGASDGTCWICVEPESLWSLSGAAGSGRRSGGGRG